MFDTRFLIERGLWFALNIYLTLYTMRFTNYYNYTTTTYDIDLRCNCHPSELHHATSPGRCELVNLVKLPALTTLHVQAR